MSIKIFGLGQSRNFAQEISDYLDISLASHVEKYFPDKEVYVRADENVRGHDVYIISSLYGNDKESVNDKLIKVLAFIGSLRDASAKRITLVSPFLCFQRQDRKTESRAPITTKYIAEIFEAVGCDRILTMDVHNLSAFQNSFRIPTDNLEAKNLIADFVYDELGICGKDLVVLNPDSGGMSRADRFRKALSIRFKKEIPLAYLDKIREGSTVKGNRIIGDVKGRMAIVVDDMVSSGVTIAKCEETCMQSGGEFWAACVTHGLFVDNVVENLTKVNKIVVTDTINRLVPELSSKVVVISTAKIFAKAIRRIHDEGGSISDLLK